MDALQFKPQLDSLPLLKSCKSYFFLCFSFKSSLDIAWNVFVHAFVVDVDDFLSRTGVHGGTVQVVNVVIKAQRKI